MSFLKGILYSIQRVDSNAVLRGFMTGDNTYIILSTMRPIVSFDCH